MSEKPFLTGMTLEEMKKAMSDLGEQPYRAKQVFQWIYRGVTDFFEMSDLPKRLIDKLEARYSLNVVSEALKKASKDGDTTKYLFLLPDDHIIESVAMVYHHGNALCLSTQVGCRMGCSFCASQVGGLVRNLTIGEMMGQVLAVNRDFIASSKQAIGSIVLMGSGEPLDNYDNTVGFLRLMHAPEGLNMGYRNMTLSTCGLVGKIEALALEGLPVNLAISLHAPNDEIRKQIMPTAAANSVSAVIQGAKFYFEKTGRRVTFEYALIRDINDKLAHARELADILRGFQHHVNIIPMNEGKHASFQRSTEASIHQFCKELTRLGVNVTRRRALGQDIEGACGQLKASFKGE